METPTDTFHPPQSPFACSKGAKKLEEEPKARKTASILVNRLQEKNPLLKHMTRIPWTFTDAITTDYMIGDGVGAYFLRYEPCRMQHEIS